MPIRAPPQSPHPLPLTVCREQQSLRRLGLWQAATTVHLLARSRQALRVDVAQLRLGRAAYPLRGRG